MGSGEGDDSSRGMEVRALPASVDPAPRRIAARVPEMQEPVLGSPTQTEEAEGHSQMTIALMPIKDNSSDIEPLIPGEYYWVTRLVLPRSGEWFIAIHDPKSAGGWKNEASWEDFDHTVVAWKRIERP